MSATLLSRSRLEEILARFETLKPIVVVGDVGIDKYTYGNVTRISPEAPVPVLEVTKEWPKLGLAANISHNLETLRVASTLCGVVGDDLRATQFESLLEECGLKTWGIVRSSDRPTTYKERVTTSGQQICRIDYETSQPIDQATATKLLDRVGDFGRDHGAIIIEDYAKGTLTSEVLSRLIALGREQKKMVAVDPGRTTPPSFYMGATLLKPNLKEALVMAEALGYREKDIGKLCELLVDKLKLEKIVITLGADGMALLDTKAIASSSDKAELLTIPTAATEVFDVSGAGDTAISLLVSALEAGATLAEAAWISNCGAGVVVGKKGTATVNQEEILDFYERLTKRLNKSKSK